MGHNLFGEDAQRLIHNFVRHFVYHDSAFSRAGFASVSGKLAVPKLAVVGLGGTGSYVLDLVAKTHAKENHLYDADAFLEHNAFRAPGAASAEELDRHLTKAEPFAARYAVMRPWHYRASVLRRRDQ